MTDYDSEEWDRAVGLYALIMIQSRRVEVGDGFGGFRKIRETADGELRRLSFALSEHPAKVRPLGDPKTIGAQKRATLEGVTPFKRKAPTWPGKGEPGH